MDTSKSNRLNGKLKEHPPGPVPFQGFGTRLRRSRSKDHSNEFDNLSTTDLEITNFRQARNIYEHQLGLITKGGTLERPKRLYGFGPPLNGAESSSFIQQSLYGNRTVKNTITASNPYEDSRLLGHQYEEPQFVLDHLSKGDSTQLHETGPNFGSRRRSKDSYLMNGITNKQLGRAPPLPPSSEHGSGDFYSAYHNVCNSYVVKEGGGQLRSNTTVIPPSKLFGKSYSNSYNTSQQPSNSNYRYETKETNSNKANNSSEYSPKSQTSSNATKQISSGTAVTTITNASNSSNSSSNGGSGRPSGESDCSNTSKADNNELFPVAHSSRNDIGFSTSSSTSNNLHQHTGGGGASMNHAGDHLSTIIGHRGFSELNTSCDDRIGADSSPKQCLTSSSQSSVMHTYANPFQNGICGGSTFSEDTTGPMIPDLSTLRTPQLLKNSFTDHHPGAKPGVHRSNNERNLISYLTQRLWSQLGGTDGSSVSAEHKSPDLNEHRCSWRVFTFSLLAVVVVLLLIILALSAMNTSSFSNDSSRSDSPKVPCIVVEDLDSTSSSQLSSSSFERSDLMSPELSTSGGSPVPCPLSLPRDPLQFKEIHFNSDSQSPYSFRLAPFSPWTIWFIQSESQFINFQFYAPSRARLALFAQKNEPPSLTNHQLLQVVTGEDIFQTKVHQLSSRSVRESQLLPLQTVHFFEPGQWYLTLINDLEHTVPLVVNISAIQNVTSDCPSNCHGHGHCQLGKCQCFPGFIGHDCADNVCPVFCGGHGQYLQGSCRCEAGWKGRECTIRAEQCEVSDCNSNGLCIEGTCQCRTGFKGEHCELADCLDPDCSQHGSCIEGVCICKVGWSGANCSQPDSKLYKFLPNCSNNGVYDFEAGKCHCFSQYSGADCSQFSCSLKCGPHGTCENGRCQCQLGWSGSVCEHQDCDPRCLEHGKCVNGTCVCQDGWIGRYCTLDGCPNMCSKHGRCVSSEPAPNLSFNPNLEKALHWACLCDQGWGGRDCSSPQETNCTDEIDNDNDGLIDCADSECCSHEQCHHLSLMCITSPNPLDILLRKQPLSPISSFFQKVHFLIEENSVQSYAQKETYSENRVSVIRGQVVSKEFNGLIGVRVSVATDPQFGFTLTRFDGWFDIVVNGGGIVTLQFQRNPFYPIKKSIYVAWNEISVMANPIVMYSLPDNGNDFFNYFNHRASSFSSNHFLGFDFSNIISLNARKFNTSNYSDNCEQHDYELMKNFIKKSPSANELGLTKNTGFMCGQESCVLAETQTVHEKITIGSSQVALVYQSSLTQGYLSTLHIRLTPATIPRTMRFVLLRILIEGIIHEKIFEADPMLEYTFAWNKRNVYKQKVYGFAAVKVQIGFIYHGCPNVVWSAFQTKMRAFDMEISELGFWNLNIHHRYNFFDSLFQRGDGQIVYFQDSDSDTNHRPFSLAIEVFAGSHLQPHCAGNTGLLECGTTLTSARFFSLISLSSAPDGSLFVGDANLIRRITPDGRINIVYQFKGHSNQRQNYEYYLAYNSADGYLYISDADRLQIVRIQISDKFDAHHQQDSSLPEVEVVVGTGERCLPRDRNLCGDGKTGPEVQLLYPKGLAFGLDGSLYFADGAVIRMLDTSGYVRRIVGQWSKHQWKPFFCATTRAANEIKLHWPTSLAVNPVDGTLYFVDNDVILQLNHELQVSIVAGMPAFCQENITGTFRSREPLFSCESNKLDARLFSHCGEDLLFGPITFTPNGVLYIVDFSGQSENRIFSLHPDGTLVHEAGYKKDAPSSTQQLPSNCSVERCADIGGHNCTCLISDSPSRLEHVSFQSDRMLAVKRKLFSISALTSTGDGTLYVADEGSLHLYRMRPYAPQLDDQLEFKILAPNLGEMYIFNKYGQHTSTRSTATGRTLFTFHYSQDNNFGKLIDVVDAAGTKLSFMRDSSGSLHMIESSIGFKSRTTVNKFGLLEQIDSHFNSTIYLDYYSNGLIRSKLDSITGQFNFYLYDQDGRLTELIQPTGTCTELKLRHSDFGQMFTATEIALFDEEARSNTSEFELHFDANSLLRLIQNEQSLDMQLKSDGSLLVNSSNNVNAHFIGKVSQLSQAMLPVQAMMFPQIAKCRIEHSTGRDGNSVQSLNLAMEYALKMKSSMIDAVEKFVMFNNTLSLKLEYDWKANREIYYNHSQRPILYLQFDDNARPIQWVPNTTKGWWLAQNIGYDKSGLLASFQDGTQTHGYMRDRVGRLIEMRRVDRFIRYSYAEGEPNHLLQLPNSVTLQSGHKYFFSHDRSGRLRAIITPKSAKHEFDMKILLGLYRFSYCPPIIESKVQEHSTTHCYLTYFDERKRLVMKLLPFGYGKIVYRYGRRESLSKEYSKDLHRHNDDDALVDQVLFGNGLVERWYDSKNGHELRGIWKSYSTEFVVTYKYTRSGLIKQQSYLFGSIDSVSPLTFNYRYDSQLRVRAIQSKLGSINLPPQEFTYNVKGVIETIGNFRYFERNPNETLIGDGVALFVRRYESSQNRIRHASLTISDKEVFRVDYLYDQLGQLLQTRNFMRHLGANKIRLQNYTYDLDNQLVEVQGREHWRFVYDFNGNLVTFLYLGNRIDIDYDLADRVRNFGKGQDSSPQSGSSPYITDMRGFLVQRGDEHLEYNHMGQLLSAVRPNRYEVYYTYDYLGRLVIRRDHQKNVTQYFYGNPHKPHLVSHAFNNADGRVLSFTYDDADDSLIMLRVNNENFYVACDQAKSPLLVFDHRGQVVKEIHRSPYGHILFDSSPTFYLPVDFQGGIPDSVTNLVHFANGRVYDTLTGRWLTPHMDLLLKANLVEQPRLVHQYHFAFNDPISPYSTDKLLVDNFLSLTKLQSMLEKQSASLVEQTLNRAPLQLLTQLSPLFRSPVRSNFFSSLKFIIDELKQFSSFKTNYYSKLSHEDWTAAKSMWNLFATENALFANSGILLAATGKNHLVQLYATARADSTLVEFTNMVLNGSTLVNMHLVIDGQDHFYLVKEHLLDSRSRSNLTKYQHLLNFTVQQSQNDLDNKAVLDIQIKMNTVMLNIRFGSTVVKEKERVLRLAKKYALSVRLSQERSNIVQNNFGLSNWTEEERQFLLNTNSQERYLWSQPETTWNNNLPLKVEHYHSITACPQLADDATNIVLKSKQIG